MKLSGVKSTLMCIEIPCSLDLHSLRATRLCKVGLPFQIPLRYHDCPQAVSLAKMGRSGLTKQVNGDVALSLMV